MISASALLDVLDPAVPRPPTHLFAAPLATANMVLQRITGVSLSFA